MALLFTPAVQAKWDAGLLHQAILLDLYCENETLHGWTWPGPMEFEGITYESLYEIVHIDTEVQLSLGLQAPETEITFDGSRVTDHDHFVGKFWQSVWHQRRMRWRIVLIEPEADPMSVVGIIESYHGRMDYRSEIEAPGGVDVVTLSCEGGLFRVRGRNMHTRTHADQQLRAPGDRFFDLVSEKQATNPVWGKRETVISRGGGWVNSLKNYTTHHK